MGPWAAIIAGGFCLLVCLQIQYIGIYIFLLSLSDCWQYYFCPIMNTGIVLALIVGFLNWFRYGGTLLHDNKPEWDTIPAIVKKDIFFARATVDDLPALKAVRKKSPMSYWKRPMKTNKLLQRLSRDNDSYGNPLLCF